MIASNTEPGLYAQELLLFAGLSKFEQRTKTSYATFLFFSLFFFSFSLVFVLEDPLSCFFLLIAARRPRKK